jgi:hypothetical protein
MVLPSDTLPVVAGAAQAQSTTRSFYDGRGSFAGQSVTRERDEFLGWARPVLRQFDPAWQQHLVL